MKAIKKIVAAAVAVVSIGAIGVTASAAESLPADWMAVYQNGAPTSVNKVYPVTVESSPTGYKVTCDYFNGGSGSVVTVTKPGGSTFFFTEEGTYKYTVYGSGGNTATFKFSALGSSENTNAGGMIKKA